MRHLLKILLFASVVVGLCLWAHREYCWSKEKQQYGYSALHWAAMEGNTQLLRQLLTPRVYPSEPSFNSHCPADSGSGDGPPSGETPLHLAAEYGRIEAVRLLLADGANVDARDSNGETPLYRAADKGHSEVVKVLLSKGANVNAADRFGYTPLIALTSGTKDVRTARLLLGGGADVRARNKYGDTALHHAADWSCGSIDITRLLLAHGADVLARDDDGQTPLKNAAMSEDPETVELLISRGAMLNAGNDALIYNVSWYASDGTEQEACQCAKLLIQHGAPVNARSWDGKTPLYCAAIHGRHQLASLLRANGGKAPEIEALVGEGKIPEVSRLLKSTPSLIHKPDSESNDTLIHIAAKVGDVTMAKLLLSNGADLGSRNGKTPLHSAALGDQPSMIEFLISMGADVGAQDFAGQTPLHAAASEGNLRAAVTLIDHGADVNSQSHGTSRRDDSGLWGNTLLAETPLHCAVRNGQLKIAQYLVAHGANIRARDGLGRTPLHLVVSEHVCGEQLQMAKLLVAHGAEVNAKDNDCRTPIFQAARNGNTDVVRFLMKSGARPDRWDRAGQTPIDYAKNAATVRMLIECH